MPSLPPKPVALALCLAAVALIGTADALTGEQISLAVLYVLPIIAASWIAGLGWGLSIAGVAVALLLLVGVLV